MLQRPEGLAGLLEEDMLVIDRPDGDEGFSEAEVLSQNGQRGGHNNTRRSSLVFVLARSTPETRALLTLMIP